MNRRGKKTRSGDSGKRSRPNEPPAAPDEPGRDSPRLPESDTGFLDALQGLLATAGERPVPHDPDSPRGRILSAALELFAEKGFRGASTRAIAARARVNLAMIHYYFGNKRTLYRIIITDRIIRNFRRLSEELESAESPEERLFTITRSFLNLFRGDPTMARLASRELAEGGENLIHIFKALSPVGPHGLVRLVELALEEGAREGRLRELDPRHLLLTFIGLAYGVIFLRPVAETLFETDFFVESEFHSYLETLRTLLFEGLLSREAKE